MNIARVLMILVLVAAILLPCRVGTAADTIPNSKLGAEAAKILGDWALSYTTKDTNRNGILDESERKAADSAAELNSATGFLKFEKGGKVEMDRKLRFKGRYEIVAQEPRDELVLTFDKDIGRYRMVISRITDQELVLEPGIGMFNVYGRP